MIVKSYLISKSSQASNYTPTTRHNLLQNFWL